MPLSIALSGAILTGGCAILYTFDYSSGSAGSGGSSSSSGHSSDVSSSSSSGSGGGVTSSGGCPMDGAGGGSSGPQPTWQMRYGGAGIDLAGHQAMDFDPSAQVFITGVFTSPVDLGNGTLTANGKAFFLAMLNLQDGTPMWSTVLADSTGTVSSLASTHDGGVVVAGSFAPTANLNGMPVMSTGGHDMFLAKFDGKGACLWHHEYGDPEEQYANAVTVDVAGNIYLTGNTKGMFLMNGCTVTQPSAAESAFVAKFDGNGACLWVKQFGQNAQGLSIAPIGDPKPVAVGVAVGGTFTGKMALAGQMLDSMSANTPAPYLATFDTMGQPLAAKQFPGTKVILADDNPYTGGALYGVTSAGGASPGIAFGTINSDGATIFPTKHLNGTEACSLESIARQSVGDIFLSGYYACGALNIGKAVPNHGAQDVFLARLNDMGVPISGAGYGDAASQIGRNVRADAGGHIYIFGDFKGNLNFDTGSELKSAGDTDMFIVKFDPAVFP